jgi:hypothetical protein
MNGNGNGGQEAGLEKGESGERGEGREGRRVPKE